MDKLLAKKIVAEIKRVSADDTQDHGMAEVYAAWMEDGAQNGIIRYIRDLVLSDVPNVPGLHLESVVVTDVESILARAIRIAFMQGYLHGFSAASQEQTQSTMDWLEKQMKGEV